MPEGVPVFTGISQHENARTTERDALQEMQENFSVSLGYLRALQRFHAQFEDIPPDHMRAIDRWADKYSKLQNLVTQRLQDIDPTALQYGDDYHRDPGIALFSRLEKELAKDESPFSDVLTTQRRQLRDLASATRKKLDLPKPDDDQPLPIHPVVEPADQIYRGKEPASANQKNNNHSQGNKYRDYIFAVGNKAWDRRGEIGIGIVTGAAVKITFATAATALTLPVAPVLAVGGLVAGAAASYAKAHYVSRRNGVKLTRKEILMSLFKGAAYAFGGEIIGYGLTSLLSADFMNQNLFLTMRKPPTINIPNSLYPANQSFAAPPPVFDPPTVLSIPTEHLNPATPPLTTATGATVAPAFPPVYAAPPAVVYPAPLVLPPPPPGAIFRAEILSHLKEGDFNGFPMNLKERLVNALSIPGHENWRLVMTRLGDAGYYDFNGLGGAPNNLSTKKLGAELYGIAGRIASTFNLQDPMADSIRKSVRYLSKLQPFRSKLTP